MAKIFSPEDIGAMLVQVKATPQADGSVVIAKGDIPPEAMDVLNGETGDTGQDSAQPAGGPDLMDMFSKQMGGGDNGKPYSK